MTDEVADRLIGIALKALDHAARLGSGPAKGAAAVLRRQRGGYGIDDRVLLDEVARIGTQYAVSIVARRYGTTPSEVAAIERRLRRKLRTPYNVRVA